MQLIAERLCRGEELRTPCPGRISRENRRTGKAKQVVLFEVLDDSHVHIAKLTAMTLVKDNNNVLAVYLMPGVLLDERSQLLYRCDDDPRIRVFHLSLQDCRRGVAVRRTLFKAVILFHGLIVEVFAVNHEQHLVDIRQLRSQSCRLERGQRFTGAGCMPDVAAALNAAVFLVVVGNFDTVENTLGCRNLVRSHNHQHILRGKNTVPRKDIQNSMLCEKRLGKVDQIRNNAVMRVRPEAGKLKAVACLFLA